MVKGYGEELTKSSGLHHEELHWNQDSGSIEKSLEQKYP